MIIAPSLLAANFARLDREIARFNRSGADWLHLDIMDGHFVPNVSFGPGLVRSLRPLSRRFFDVHLMCTRPEILFQPFADAGVQQLTIHVELGTRVEALLWKIRSLGLKAGLALNPPTPMRAVLPHLQHIDLLLIMTVNPGFGGQEFIHEAVPKVQHALRLRSESDLDFRIQVDGGINLETAAECARAGADTLVSGTALFRQTHLSRAVRRMRQVAQAARPASPIPPDPAPASRKGRP